ncbi:uncharacterized protein LOC116773288 [Danaus plexippus]|uniref:uncharacterized protein LOC116773288 n=1 Tax=Danaus plexippus TaxID=13037 RepID=UPI002AB0E8A2|nr:uncharacterized protein LOC116773288 [Danaus plexippus]
MDCVVAKSFLVKLSISNKNAFAKILWKYPADYLFSIQILMENQSWSGQFSYDNAKIFQERLRKSKDDYFSEVKDALQQNNEMYTCLLTIEDSKTAKFCWKKSISESSAVVLQGSVNLERDTNELTKDEIIDYLLDQNKNLQSIIDEYKHTNDILNSDLDKSREEFKKLVDIKDSLESNLYGKFIQLLNSKKRRIHLLECNIENSNIP